MKIVNDTQVQAIPEWLEKYALLVKNALGLQNWAITVNYRDLGTSDTGNISGECKANPRYNFATVFISRFYTTLDNAAKETIIHEMLELLMSPLVYQINRIIDLIPEELQDHAMTLFDDAKEPLIVNLSMALLSLLPDIS